MPDLPAALARRPAPWLMAALVLALVVACYWPALNGAFLWDDPAHVPRPELRSWSGLGRIWTDVHATQQYYPVLFSAFWLEHRMWGDSPRGYHLANVLFHAGSCVLLALVLRRLWAERKAAGGRAMPEGTEWLAAALFAVHPVCVESVAWITEQKNTLSLLFYLLAALGYLGFERRRRPLAYAGASFFFLLALGSKTATVTLPAALLVLRWWRDGRIAWKRDVVPLLPWFAAALAMGLFTSWDERKVIGAEGGSFELPALQRILLAGRIVWFYLGKLVWPAHLNFFYPRWDVARESSSWVGWLGAAALLTAALWLVRRRTRAPLAAWLLFVGGLFPILGLFKVFFFLFSYVNDHFQYLAILAPIALAAAGIGLALERAPRAGRAAGLAGVAALVLVLAGLSRAQAGLYRDNETLFRATVAREPGSWMGHHILAFALAKIPGREAEAIEQYRTAIALYPDYPDSHLGLGVELAHQPGGRAGAIAEYERAVQLRPVYAEAHNNLGAELLRVPGRSAEAIAHFRAALAVKPEFAEAHANLGDALARQPGQLPEAMAQYTEALRLNPNLAWVHCSLAQHLAQVAGREAEAVAQFEEAIRLQPDYLEAHNGLAIVSAQAGNLQRARSEWEIALRINPAYQAARNNLRHLDEIEGR